MDRFTHPIEQEEVMAYLDGELETERASAVTAHLDQCAECQAFARNLCFVSERMAAWQVEPAPQRLAERILGGLEALPPTQPVVEQGTAGGAPRHHAPRLRFVLGFAGVLGVLVLIVAISIPNLLRTKMSVNQAPAGLRTQPGEGGAPFPGGAGGGGAGPPQYLRPSAPMIARTAGLTLLSRDFDKARVSIEAVVRQHGGYAANLTVSARVGAARYLTATFRLPATELDRALAELKKLARVEQESQGGEEVTQPYVDLLARLSNARNTEQRLNEILRQRAGKVPDVLAVEREIARVREEIERMEAERKSLENRVQFATLQLELREEYQAQLEVSQPSTRTQLRNAVVEGFHNLADSALGLVAFLLRYGPSLLFWFAVLFWPARLVWRRLRTRRGAS